MTWVCEKDTNAVKCKISAPVLDTGRSQRLVLTGGKAARRRYEAATKGGYSMRERAQSFREKKVGGLVFK